MAQNWACRAHTGIPTGKQSRYGPETNTKLAKYPTRVQHNKHCVPKKLRCTHQHAKPIEATQMSLKAENAGKHSR